MKLAAIDLGSNSFHMVIVEVSSSGSFQVVDREKEMVRLGASTLSRGQLSGTAMTRGLATLVKYKRLAQNRRVDKILAVATSAIREARNGFDCAIGTSGTILALGALALQEEAPKPPEALHHVTVQAEAIHAVRKRLVASDSRSRLRIPGMDEGRADIIVAGAVVLDTLLERLGVREIVLCEWSLREGILLNYIHGHPRSLARAEAYPDVRRRSVVALAERCLYEEPHARVVAELALSLFDQTKALHGQGDAERSLLEYAALLHDVGHHISYPGHHKHTYYLIKNGDLRGFDPLEIEVIASVARYHRRGHPRRKDGGYGDLPKPLRRTVRILAGCLRIADALDRSHRQVIGALSVSERSGVVRILCGAAGNSDLEMWGAPRRAELLSEEVGRPIRIEARLMTAAVARLRAGRG